MTAISILNRPLRIAFCISGQIRDEEISFSEIKKEAERLGAEVFVSVWLRRGAKTGGIVNWEQAGRMFGGELALALPSFLTSDRAFDLAIPEFEQRVLEDFSDVDESTIRKYFDRATIDIEAEEFNLDFGDDGITDKHSLRMLYKVWRCNMLKRSFERRSGQQFDVVVRMRPDVVPLLDEKALASVLSADHANSIFIPSAHQNQNWLMDALAVSTSPVADHYAALFGKALQHPVRPWKMIHHELAQHLGEAGIEFHSIGIRRWMQEDFLRRQRNYPPPF